MAEPTSPHCALTVHMRRALALVELQQLADDFWARVDGVANGSAADVFIPAGRLSLGPVAADGREEIRQLLERRSLAAAATQRSTRHVTSNYRLIDWNDGRAVLRSHVRVYAATGALPQLPSLPSTSGDFEDVAARQADDSWLFVSRTALPPFTGTPAPAFVADALAAAPSA